MKCDFFGLKSWFFNQIKNLASAHSILVFIVTTSFVLFSLQNMSITKDKSYRFSFFIILLSSFSSLLIMYLLIKIITSQSCKPTFVRKIRIFDLLEASKDPKVCSELLSPPEVN